MQRRPILTLIIPLLSLAGLIPSIVDAASDRVDEPLPPEGALRIRYENGVMDAAINNARLSEVLHELEARTGARIAQGQPADTGERVSAIVRTQPLEDAIRTILRGYSFAIYADASSDAPVVILLSKPKSAARPTSGVAAAPRVVQPVRSSAPGRAAANQPAPGAKIQAGTPALDRSPAVAASADASDEDDEAEEDDSTDELPGAKR